MAAAGGSSAVSLDNVGNHPNAWFRASVALAQQERSGGGDSGGESAAAAAATVAAADSKMKNVEMADSGTQVSP